MNDMSPINTRTLAYIPPDALHTVACKRIPVAKLLKMMPDFPVRYLEALEQNQQIASCCRHPENHDIEAFFSCPAEARKGVPDIYKFHCTCGRVHARFCIGGDHPVDPDKRDFRPFWDVR